MKRQTILEVIVLLFIGLFAYAALSKIMDYQNFRITLGKSPLLTNFAGLVAWLIPAVELLLVLLLSIQRWRLLGLYGAFTLMVSFTVYLTAILIFFDDVPCSCGGILNSLPWSDHIVFNCFFILLALMGIALASKELNTQRVVDAKLGTPIGKK